MNERARKEEMEGWREGRWNRGREGGREGERERERGRREGVRKRGKGGGREGGKEGGIEGREGRSEGGREGRSEGGREGGREDCRLKLTCLLDSSNLGLRPSSSSCMPATWSLADCSFSRPTSYRRLSFCTSLEGVCVCVCVCVCVHAHTLVQ